VRYRALPLRTAELTTAAGALPLEGAASG